MKKQFILPLLLVLYGCQEFLLIETKQVNQDIYFDSIDAVKTCDGNLYIEDIIVAQENCEANCIRWMAVRHNAPENNEHFISFPIKYGQQIPNTPNTVAAQKLTKKKHSINATLACHQDNDIRPLKLMGVFSVNTLK